AWECGGWPSLLPLPIDGFASSARRLSLAARHPFPPAITPSSPARHAPRAGGSLSILASPLRPRPPPLEPPPSRRQSSRESPFTCFVEILAPLLTPWEAGRPLLPVPPCEGGRQRGPSPKNPPNPPFVRGGKARTALRDPPERSTRQVFDRAPFTPYSLELGP